MTEYKLIDVNLLDTSPFQVREKYDEEDLSELADFKQSITNDDLGIRNPILVRRVGKRYEMAAGHRRAATAKLAGIHQVWCRIEDLTDEQMMKEVIVENYHRKGLSTIETFNALEQYRKARGLKENSFKELHEILGISEKWIAKIYDGIDIAKDLKYKLSVITDEGKEQKYKHTNVNKISDTKPLDRNTRILLIDKTTEKDSEGWSRHAIQEVVTSLNKLSVERQRALIKSSLNAEDTKILAEKFAKESPNKKDDPNQKQTFIVEDKLIDNVADNTFTSSNVVEVIDAIKPLPDKIKETLINTSLSAKDMVKIAEAITPLTDESKNKILVSDHSPYIKVELAKLKTPELIGEISNRIHTTQINDEGAIKMINRVLYGDEPQITTIIDIPRKTIQKFLNFLPNLSEFGVEEYAVLGETRWNEFSDILLQYKLHAERIRQKQFLKDVLSPVKSEKRKQIRSDQT